MQASRLRRAAVSRCVVRMADGGPVMVAISPGALQLKPSFCLASRGRRAITCGSMTDRRLRNTRGVPRCYMWIILYEHMSKSDLHSYRIRATGSVRPGDAEN